MQARRQFDTGVDTSRNDAAPERAEPGGRGVTTVCTPRTARSLAAVLLVAFVSLLALPLQAQAQTGICGRTQQVRDEIVRLISGVTSCAGVTDSHLAGITASLVLEDEGITALAAGDFDGLTGLYALNLASNSLTELPDDVFDDLTALVGLNLASNSLTELPDDVFDDLTALVGLTLASNSLTELPDDVFDELTALTELDLRSNDLTELPDDVFDELTALTTLNLASNSLTELPDDVFDELTALTTLFLEDNSLTELPDDVFDELTALTTLTLASNSLTELPDDVFEEVTVLVSLYLQGNPGAPFSPTADALPDDGTVLPAGGTVTLDGSGSDGGPWGTNVTYRWRQTSGPTSGVTFDDAASAKPVVTIPALTDGAELTFTLTVTGRSGTNTAGTAPDTDTATVTVDSTAGICGRTEAVRGAIVGKISGVVSCADVTDTHLGAITGTLSLGQAGITALAAGDFDGLTSLTQLNMGSNSLAELPDNVFDELTALTTLNLGGNSLSTLKADVFEELTALTSLRLHNNSLTELPDDVFEELTALTTLRLEGNPGAPFSPTADALPDDGTVSFAGGTVTLDGSGSDGGPWGTNVTYSWRQTSGPTSGVTFNDAASAKPEVTIPALADGAELTFTLTVTAVPSGAAGTAPDTDTATVTAEFDSTAGICGRTEAVRDGIVALVSGAINCALVTDVHLGAITGTLGLRNKGITALAAGDFDGLTALTELWLGDNDLTTLPAGVFDELTALTFLGLLNNSLSTLDDDVFEELTALTSLYLAGNPGEPFSPTADAVPDDGEVSFTGDTVTLDGSGSDGGPWGANVTYSWAASGATVTFDDAASAKPMVTIPALAAGAELTFTLTVTGRGHVSRGTAPDTDTATVTVTAFDPTAGICGRTEQVRTAILAKISSVVSCADVTDTHLAAITGGLDLPNQGITALVAGDFDGLTALGGLYLSNNSLTTLPDGVFDELAALVVLGLNENDLTTLPAGVFDELTALADLQLQDNSLTSLPDDVFDELTSLLELYLQDNSLETLPAGVFDGLTALVVLGLWNNSLTTLPDDVFDGLTALGGLYLSNNSLTTLPDGVFDELAALVVLGLNDNPGAPFSPTADALPDDGTVLDTGGTVTLDGSGSDGGPWGANVTYMWALTSPASGVTVTFDDDASATPEVTIPALTAGAELTFTLTVNGRGYDGFGSGGTAPDTDTATVTVEAPAANAAPSFDSPATFSAAENQTAVGTVAASDSDTGDSVTGYAIHGGADRSKFSIVASTGVLTFASAPNFEAPADADTGNDYVVVVRVASGTGTRVKTAEVTITVTVTDVDGEAPGVPVAPTVSSASVTSLTATWTAPANAGPPIRDYDYRYGLTSSGPWTEVTNTPIPGSSATIASLAEDTEYYVQVRATNDEGTSGWSAPGSGSTDANASPSFTSAATFSAAENRTAVGTVQASDSDTGDSVTGYAIHGGADRSKFSIAPATGVLTFASAPNFEAPADADTDGDYVVVVRATSGTGERVKTADQAITVTVTDAGGEAPGVPVAPSVSSASVTSLTATWTAPANAGPPIGDYDYRYRVTSPVGNWTEVTTTTITALGATITQLAENTEYDVQVQATNGEGTSGWSDSGSGSTDANAAPSFTSPETFNVPENRTAVGTVAASDSDTGDSVTGYAIQGGADASKFSIAPATGVLTFASAPNFEAPADADTDGDYVVVVRAMSGTGARAKTAEQTITVTVTNAGGEAPGVPVAPTVSSASPTSVTATWAAPTNAGPAIGDYDYRYRVTSPVGNWTEVTTTTITALGATITELAENTEYDVQVQATNGEGTSGWSGSGSGSTDANAAPSFTSPETFNAPENRAAVGTVQASDSDTDDSVTAYAIHGGADRSKFSLVASTGVLTFASAPNFEAPADADTGNDYVVVVRATSGAGERVKTADQTITVTVTDVGGEAPGVPVAPTVSSASVTSLTATWAAPANAGPAITDYDYQYRVTSPVGNWTEVTTTTITALSATIGQLAENTEYDVQVQATNGEGTSGWSDSGSGSTDANASPSFTSPATFSAPENQTAVGTVAASDSDTDDSVTGYAIQGGADASKFSIAPASGALTFASAPNFEAPADADTDGDYVVVVRATSGAGERVKTADQTITVTVTDAGGEAPGVPVAPTVSSASPTSVTATWTAPANAGPAITDYDYRYRVTSPVGNWTEVTTTTITALGATITELAENTEYDVQVQATNGEGTSGWSGSGSGSTDANAAPSFTSPETFNVPENRAAVGTVQASDSDTDDSVTAYAIHGGADRSKFSLVASTGVLTFASAPNFEAPADTDTGNDYVVVVRATSGAGARVKTAEVTITVTVTDVGGEAPGVPVAPTVSSASVTSVTATWTAPTNAGPAITDYDYQYRVTSPVGNWTEVTTTTITALGATITQLAEDTEYDVQVRATNGEGTGDWSAPGSGSTDANASPSFTSSATFSAPENQTAVGTVHASDSDTDDSVTGYAIHGGADASKFSIAPASGVVTFASAPNFEAPADADTGNDYVVVVRATSGTGERAKTADRTITVTVTDAGGEAPGVPTAPTVSSASVTSVNVSWTAPANAGPAIGDYDYRYRAGSPVGNWTEVTTTTITALGATITELAENAGYDVQVRATNDEGTSGWSDSGSGSTDANAAPSFDSPATFNAPENQTAVGTVAASDSDTGDSVTGYAIHGGADRSKFSLVASTGVLTFASAPNFEAPADADTGNDYVVVVRATSGAGVREKTADQTITVTVTDVGGEAPGVPAAPFVSSASLTSVTAAWTAPANAGPAIGDYDYRYRVTSPQGSWTEVTTTTITGLSATIGQLTEGTEYDVQVRATNDEGTSGWSDPGTGTPTGATEAGAISNAPENLQATAGDAEATLRWDAPINDSGADITGYAYRYKASGGDFIAYTDIPESGPGQANARSYTVTELTNGLEYVFHVRALNEHGGGLPAEVTVTLPGIVSSESEELPAEVTLSANYPNPFNPETTIRYALPQAGQVRLVVYDLLGHEVEILVDQSKPAGDHTVRFGADNLASGLYVYRLQAQGKTIVRTMILVK